MPKQLSHMTRSLIRLMTILSVTVLTACASNQSITAAISAYQQQAEKVSLGQSKAQVLALLEPTQMHLRSQSMKAAETYIDNDRLKEIVFFRSRSFADGIVTDDEFTPYVFEDGVLVAIGWTAIGGPKTQAQSRNNDSTLHLHSRFIY
ncbi:MAG: hypothetical protein CL692_03095 [Cellvibrionales bacterium]|nr:hypothetical protein [Cellvibrionales bacterium]